jgi:hypothetical protein
MRMIAINHEPMIRLKGLVFSLRRGGCQRRIAIKKANIRTLTKIQSTGFILKS